MTNKHKYEETPHKGSPIFPVGSMAGTQNEFNYNKETFQNAHEYQIVFICNFFIQTYEDSIFYKALISHTVFSTLMFCE